MKKKCTFQKISILFVAALLCILVVNFYTNWYKEDIPVSKDGVLNLSHWNLSDDGTVPLSGGWVFYPNQLLSPSDIKKSQALNLHFLQVPGRWESDKSGMKMADRGVGTYRLTIRTDGRTSMYGLKITNIRSSCKIFIDGKEIAKIGNPTTFLSKNYETNILPLMAFFASDKDTIDLVVQVANWDYYSGGIIQHIYLGSQQEILHDDLMHKVLESIGISALLIFGILYIGVYFFSKQNKHLLFLGLVCVSYAFVRGAEGEKFFNFIFDFLSYWDVYRVKNATICMNVIFMGFFIRELGNVFISSRFLKGIIFALSLGIFSLFAVPKEYLYIVEILLGFCYLCSYLIFTISIFKATRSRKYGTIGKKGALLLLCSIFLITIAFCGIYLYFDSNIHTNIWPTFILLGGLSIASYLYISQYVKTYESMNALNHKLVQVDREKDQLLTQTSNAFRTPLHSIISIAKSTVNSSDDSLRQQKNLILISSVAARLSSLVNDIIDFQSMQNHTLRLSCHDFDVSGTVQAVIEVMFHIKKGEQVQLLNMVAPGHFYVNADEDRLHQILVHVVGNALKYTEKGFVKITAEVQGSEIRIYVEDTGAGISMETQKILFDNRSNESKNENPSLLYASIGLKISKMLAQNMQGDISLQKSIVGEGSIFVIQMPRMTVVPAKNMEISDGNEDKNVLTELGFRKIDESSGVKPYTLLVVDDEAENIKTLREIFYSKDYRILEAYGGAQALELLKKHRDVSIVLTDTSMPGMTGYEMCRLIRAERSLYELPVLLFAASHMSEDIAECFEAGANDFLTKPYDVRELTARVDTLLRMKESAENTIKMETAFLQSQIKPHFLYNALSTIISLCRKDGGQAESLLKDLSNYLRKSLEIDPNHSFTSVKQELSLVESYIHIDKARFGKRLNVVYNLDENAMRAEIPSMVIQPIVENAVRHGLMKRIVGGTVIISTRIEDMELIISVSDDGQGMDEEKYKSLLDGSVSSNGIGLKNVNKRLMNAYGQGLEIQSGETCGTKVTMRIPIKDIVRKGVLEND